MNCNSGAHYALYKNVIDEWFCSVCGERINIREVNNLRELHKKEYKMNKICAFGSKIIVNRKQKQQRDKGLILMDEVDLYLMGKVISVGAMVPNDLFVDSSMLLAVNSTIIYPKSKACPLGLGFPDTYDVVEAEDIVGLVLLEEEDEKIKI